MDLEFTITNQTISRTDTFDPRADSNGLTYFPTGTTVEIYGRTA